MNILKPWYATKEDQLVIELAPERATVCLYSSYEVGGAYYIVPKEKLDTLMELVDKTDVDEQDQLDLITNAIKALGDE